MKPYPAYKDSGVEWIGEVPEGWKVKKIKYLGKIISGYSFKSDEFKNFDTGCRVLKISNIQTMRIDWTDEAFIDESYYQQLAAYRLYQEDLVFALTRPIISTGIKAAIIRSEGKILINQRNAVFRASNKLMVSWMYYILFNAKFIEHFESLIDSTGQQPNISAIDIGNISIPMPPDKEQAAIAAYLDRKTAQLDTLIERKRRLIALLQEERTAVISQAVTKGLNPAAPMKDSGIEWIGEVPEHWEVKRLKHISPQISVGLVINPSTYVDKNGTVPFFFGSNISDYHISTKKVRRITKESNKTIEKSMLHEGDLVTVRVGYPGVTAVVPKSLDGSNCASMMIVRRGDDFVSDFLCACFNSRVGRHQIELVAYGAAQKQFNINHAIDFWFPMPPYVEQLMIAKYVFNKLAEFGVLIGKVDKKIELLQEYRTALISAAVTGKIDVREEVIL